MKVTLYTRAGCHLCDEVKQVIESVGQRIRFEYEEFDSDPQLQLLYNEEVPVVLIDGRKAFKFRVTAAELQKKLAARS
jgi:glutaredoxin